MRLAHCHAGQSRDRVLQSQTCGKGSHFFFFNNHSTHTHPTHTHTHTHTHSQTHKPRMASRRRSRGSQRRKSRSVIRKRLRAKATRSRTTSTQRQCDPRSAPKKRSASKPSRLVRQEDHFRGVNITNWGELLDSHDLQNGTPENKLRNGGRGFAAACVIIYNDDGYVLLGRKVGCRELTKLGGQVDMCDNTYFDTAIREFKEETGTRLQKQQLMKSSHVMYFKFCRLPGHGPPYMVCFFVHSTCLNPDTIRQHFRRNNEMTGVEWVSFQDPNIDGETQMYMNFLSQFILPGAAACPQGSSSSTPRIAQRAAACPPGSSTSTPRIAPRAAAYPPGSSTSTRTPTPPSIPPSVQSAADELQSMQIGHEKEIGKIVSTNPMAERIGVLLRRKPLDTRDSHIWLTDRDGRIVSIPNHSKLLISPQSESCNYTLVQDPLTKLWGWVKTEYIHRLR